MNICEKCNKKSVFLIKMNDGREICSYCFNEEEEEEEEMDNK